MAEQRQFSAEGVQFDERPAAYEFSAEGVQFNETTPPVQEETTGGLVRLKSTSQNNEVDWNDPLNKGLVAWYPFRQKGGNVLRDVAGENHGTLQSSMNSDDWVPSPETKSLGLTLDGVDDTVEAFKVWESATLPITLSCWVKADSLLSNATPFSLHRGTTTNRFNGAFISASGTWAFGTRVSGNVRTVDSGVPVSTDEWQHLVYVIKTSSYRIGFIDGNFAAGVSGGVTWDTLARDFSLGQRYDGATGTAWDGSVSDVRIYDRALSRPEVHDLYVASRTGYQDQFKRRYFPVSTTVEEPPTEETTGGLIRLKSPKQSQPSYKTGYARSASESANPELWDELAGAWMPSLGVTGGEVKELTTRSPNLTLENIPYTNWEVKDKSLAVMLEGRDDYLNGSFCDAVNFGSKSFTVTTHFYVTAYGPIEVLLEARSSSSFYGLTTYMRSSQRVGIQLRSPGDSDTYEFYLTAVGGQLAKERIHSMSTVVDRQKSTCTQYVNGTQIGSASISSGMTDISSNTDFRFGRNIGGRYPLSGGVASLLIHHRALNAAEVKQLDLDQAAPFRQRKYVPYVLTEEETPDSVITRLGLTATPFKSYTITDKGVVVEDANGRHFLMFVF